MSSTNSPCAACRIQRRKCTQDCVFAPYFPADNPQRFAYVHKVFGASNVAKILNELGTAQREDAVKSLAYEAEARLRDPVYGCVGLISVLQHRLKQLQIELLDARKELASYIGPQALLPVSQSPAGALNVNVDGISTHHHNHMIGINPTHQYQMMQQHELLTMNGGGFEGASAAGFNQISAANAMPPSLALGPADHGYQIQPQHHQLQALPPQSPLSQKQHEPKGEAGWNIHPFC